MSKIALSPSASGSGTLTISAPNTSTDRTINLPDAAGTVFVSGQALSATTGSFSGTVSGGSTIGVGGATPAASGAGITFPATQSASSDANTLDDYEEGTWTPTFNSTGASFTYGGTRSGWYTKVGRVVTVSWYLSNVTASGTTTNALNLGGLPFTTMGGGAEQPGTMWINNAFVAVPVSQELVNQMTFYKNNTTGVTQLQPAEITGRYCVGTLTYFAS